MSIEGFTVHRRDRVYGRGRGVCFNASNVIYSKRLADLENADHECMWIWSRPNRLPRPLSGLAVWIIYTNSIDRFFPAKQVKCHSTDKPWLTPYIKRLIVKRQRAFHSVNEYQWRTYQNKVKFEISKRKKNFHAWKTKSLPKNDCNGWLDIVNKLSGRTTKKTNLCLQSDGKTLSDSELVNALNIYFTLVNADIPILGLTCLTSSSNISSLWKATRIE